jgi:hypothetical protein
MKEPQTPEERPPILGSWRNVYAFVLGELIVLIVLFTLMTYQLS